MMRMSVKRKMQTGTFPNFLPNVSFASSRITNWVNSPDLTSHLELEMSGTAFTSPLNSSCLDRTNMSFILSILLASSLHSRTSYKIQKIINFLCQYIREKSTYLVDGEQGIFAGVVLLAVGAQSSENSVQQERKSSDPLHGQHQEGMERQGLALRVCLQPLQNLRKSWIISSEKLIIKLLSQFTELVFWFYLPEFPESPVQVDLLWAIFDVNPKIFGSMLFDDIANVWQHDVLLPAALQVGQEPLRTCFHCKNIWKLGNSSFVN